MKKIAIIGSGFSSLSAACYMAQAGYHVTVLEKNKTIGGRARQFERNGFKFDMGPTFYWMPDIFEKFFKDFEKTPEDFYSLSRLDPGYEIYFDQGTRIKQSSDLSKLKETFESIEPGSKEFLDKFLRKAEYNYRVAIDKVVYKPGKSLLELIMPETVSRAPQFLTSLSYTVRKNIQDQKLRQMLEFPVLFLGAKPDKTPSFYRFMNYADMVLGSWHVEGGMIEVIYGMKRLAETLGVEIKTKQTVNEIVVERNKVKGIVVNGNFINTDAVLSGADYHHTETLLPEKYRNYSERYWNRKVFAPSAILFYIGFDKKIQNVSHHTLFFDTSFEEHASNIYDAPDWPEKPLFYASFPSKTDESLCPDGKEGAIILIPSAAGLADHPYVREKYFEQVIERMEKLTNQKLRNHVLFYESYAYSDFMKDYNAYKGNAYGLANILTQTAFLKPKVFNKKLTNLFYTGQLTVPGPGVPTAIISGKIAADCAKSYMKHLS
ncbi:MAG: phytoene desaturase [Bacteroidales bacterium]|nr:phytoene desaturase [Bacteroidales bacterium]